MIRNSGPLLDCRNDYEALRHGWHSRLRRRVSVECGDNYDHWSSNRRKTERQSSNRPRHTDVESVDFRTSAKGILVYAGHTPERWRNTNAGGRASHKVAWLF